MARTTDETRAPPAPAVSAGDAEPAGTEQPQLFISYSRKDREFVQAFDRALRARGMTTWVDWEAIPLGAPWRNEIATAIEGAEGMLFFLSAASATSAECGHEVEYAERNNKRILPVARHDMDAAAVPLNLRERNWLCMHGVDDIESAVEDVARWLQRDPDHVRQHTHLLVRAREWETRRHDNSLLVRGSELQTAENWLSQAQGKDPAPTDLHTRYILASRRAEIVRQRRITGAALAALVVCVVLALVALREKGIAQQQRATAQANELTQRALWQLQFDPEKSVGIAAQAVTSAGNLGSPATETNAVSALREALAGSHVRAILRRNRGNVETAAFSPDGREVVTAGDDGKAFLWTWRTQKSRLLHTSGSATNPGGVYAASFSPDGRYVVTGGRDEMARVWDTRTGKQMRALSGHHPSTDWITTATFSPDGRSILLASSAGDTAVWRWRSNATAPELPGIGTGHVYAAAFSPNGQYAATAGGDGVALLWDLRTNRAPQRLSDVMGASPSKRRHVRHYTVEDVAFSPDSHSLVTASDDHTARVWDVPTGKLVHTLRGHTDAVYVAQFSSDGQRIITASQDDTARVWDARTGQVQFVLSGHVSGVFDAAFSPDGAFAVTASYDNTARIWNVRTGDNVAVLRGHTATVNTALFSPDGQHVVTAGGDGTVRVWDAGTWENGRAIDRGTSMSTVDFSQDNRHLLAADFYGNAWIWDTTTWRSPTKVSDPPFQIFAARYSPDGRAIVTEEQTKQGTRQIRVWNASGTPTRYRLHFPSRGDMNLSSTFSPNDKYILAFGGTSGSTSSRGVVYIWDYRHGRTIQTRSVFQREVFDAEWSHDGRYIALALAGSPSDPTGKGTAEVWDWQHNRMLVRISSKSSVESATFSPDDRYLLTGSDDQTAHVWDWRARNVQGTSPPPLAGHTGTVVTVQFSRNGALVATASGDGTARIWDWQTSQQLFVLPTHALWAAEGAAFSPNGRFIAVASSDTNTTNGDVRVFGCDICGSAQDLLNLARRRQP